MISYFFLTIIDYFADHEAIWNEVLSERRRKKRENSIVVFLSEWSERMKELEEEEMEVDSPWNTWPGIDHIIQIYQAYSIGSTFFLIQ